MPTRRIRRGRAESPRAAVTFHRALESDAEAIAELHAAAAADLTARFGKGHWSTGTTVRSVLHSMRYGRHVIGKAGRRIVAVARVATAKPWAIDVSYFTPCRRPLYLTGMAVAPDCQRQGIGRRCLAEAVALARAWPGDALRLDAYDAAAGAGPFYSRCGFAPRGNAVYRGTPHLYFELLLAVP